MDSGRRYATFKKNSLLLFLNHAPNAYLFIKFLIEANETMTIATIYMMYIGQNQLKMKKKNMMFIQHRNRIGSSNFMLYFYSFLIIQNCLFHKAYLSSPSYEPYEIVLLSRHCKKKIAIITKKYAGLFCTQEFDRLLLLFAHESI